jgi:hypothetical protein
VLIYRYVKRKLILDNFEAFRAHDVGCGNKVAAPVHVKTGSAAAFGIYKSYRTDKRTVSLLKVVASIPRTRTGFPGLTESHYGRQRTKKENSKTNQMFR